jgi:hypothetical protein
MTAEHITCGLGGQWDGARGVARCPSHDDRHPPLSLADGWNGCVLVSCQPRWKAQAILDALFRRLTRSLQQITGRRDPCVVFDRALWGWR